mgnify:CR=1 FL=1
MKRLPCKTLISTGACPYKNKCKFIHDVRITNKCVKTIKKSDIDIKNDGFYWPKSENNSLYSPNKKNKQVFSMWNHFIDVITFQNKNNFTQITNKYSKKKRLNIFVSLSK